MKLFNKMPFMALLLAAFVAGCSNGNDGAPGAAGPAGATGPAIPGTNPPVVVPPLPTTTSAFVALSAANGTGGAVTMTDATSTGNVGSSGAVTLTTSSIVGNLNYGGALTNTTSTISGTTTASLPVVNVTDFDAAYAAVGAKACDQTLTGNLSGLTLLPGVYCFAAGATMTDSTLSLLGSSTDHWIFKIGNNGGGALTGTNFRVGVAGNGCNVTWWVHDGATVTANAGVPEFKGIILAGQAITMTGTSTPSLLLPFSGKALAKAGVTLTRVAAAGCP